MAKTAKDIRIERHALLVDIDAGGDVELGDFVYVAADGDVEVVDKDAVGTANSVLGCVVAGMGAVGLETQTEFKSGDRVTVCVQGKVYGFSGLTPGAVQYVGDDGEITETAPTATGDVVQEVALALSATEILVLGNALNIEAANS